MNMYAMEVCMTPTSQAAPTLSGKNEASEVGESIRVCQAFYSVNQLNPQQRFQDQHQQEQQQHDSLQDQQYQQYQHIQKQVSLQQSQEQHLHQQKYQHQLSDHQDQDQQQHNTQHSSITSDQIPPGLQCPELNGEKRQPEVLNSDFTNIQDNPKKTCHLACANVENKAKPHSCQYCLYAATSLYNLKAHVNSKHTNEIKYCCTQCDYFSFSKASLNYHTKSHNPNEYKTCPQCSFGTHAKHILEGHMRIHKQKTEAARVHHCKHCSYAATSASNLKIHVNSRHTNEVKYACSNCDYYCYSKASLNFHIKTHDPTEYKKCSECSFGTYAKHVLDRHIKTHGKKHPYQCPHCNYAATIKASLAEHIKVLHNAEKLDYSCTVCDYKTVWKRSLKRHLKLHNGDMYHCSQCLYNTGEKQKLCFHERKEHGIVEREHVCNTCPYSADQLYKLEEHILRKHGKHNETPTPDPIYTCSECSYQTKWKTLLNAHGRLHSGDLFRCSKCDYTTHIQTRLKGHEKKHIEQTKCLSEVTMSQGSKYNCPHCVFRTTEITRLKEHINLRHFSHCESHLTCSECGFRTKWQKSMKNHQKTHTGGIFKCSKCDYTTPIKENLVNHEKEEKHEIYMMDNSLHTVSNPKKPTKKGAITHYCPHCIYSSDRKNRVNKHIKKNHVEKIVRNVDTTQDDFSSNGKPSVILHERMPEACAHSCEFCAFNTDTLNVFKEHFKETHKMNVVECQFCDHFSLSIHDSLDHLKSHQANKSMNPVKLSPKRKKRKRRNCSIFEVETEVHRKTRYTLPRSVAVVGKCYSRDLSPTLLNTSVDPVQIEVDHSVRECKKGLDAKTR